MDWKDIETAPKDGTRVLLWAGFPNTWDVAVCFWDKDGWSVTKDQWFLSPRYWCEIVPPDTSPKFQGGR